MLQHILTIFVLFWTKHLRFRPEVLQHHLRGGFLFSLS
nr:MAG TPA: hypothetical protein [Caudoviricetes sp.]